MHTKDTPHHKDSPVDAEAAAPALQRQVADLQQAAEDNEDLTRARHMVNVIQANGTLDLGNLEHEVRPHQDAVRVLFGRAPWLWQQYTLLCAEKKARFQADHPDDFVEFSWKEYAEKRFTAWVDGPPKPDSIDEHMWAKHKTVVEHKGPYPFSHAEYNPDFGAYYHRFDTTPGVQEALKKCILEPFVAIDLITGGEKDNGWDFEGESEAVSAYTYVSVVGGGHLVALIVAFVQIALPLVLLAATWQNVDNEVHY